MKDLPIGGIIIRDLEAQDADAGINALVEYQVVPSLKPPTKSPTPTSLFDTVDAVEEDGFGVFEFAASHVPVLTLRKALDYESVRRYLVTIVASVKDRKSRSHPTLCSPCLYLFIYLFCNPRIEHSRIDCLPPRR